MAKVSDFVRFITGPRKAFEEEEKTSTWAAIKYAAIWLIPGLILTTAISILNYIYNFPLLRLFGLEKLSNLITANVDVSRRVIYTIAMLPVSYLAGLVGLFIAAVWFHMWAYIFGARLKLKQTIKVIFYGNTPSFLFGWLPFVSYLAKIWSYIMYGIGLVKLQKMSEGKAILTVVLGVIVPVILVILFVIALAIILITLGINLDSLSAY